jgi:hypothetical protein
MDLILVLVPQKDGTSGLVLVPFLKKYVGKIHVPVSILFLKIKPSFNSCFG